MAMNNDQLYELANELANNLVEGIPFSALAGIKEDRQVQAMADLMITIENAILETLNIQSAE